MPLLEVKGLKVAYDSLEVIRKLDFDVNEGEVVAILGGNGAGKTTTLKAVAGLLKTQAGSIRLAGRTITGLPPHRVARLGLALVPEGRQLFPEHTVRENLQLGGYVKLIGRESDHFQQAQEEVLALFPRVRERLDQPAGQLSGGEQQMVAIARALVSRPRILLLDEPSLGLSPLLVQSIFEAFAALKQRGLTLMIVEQMATMALKLCDRAYVLERGRINLSGTRSEISAHHEVIRAYLGSSHRRT